VSKDVPVTHDGGVIFQSVSINDAANIPQGGLTEYFNADIRSGEFAYVGAAVGNLVLTPPASSTAHSSILITINPA